MFEQSISGMVHLVDFILTKSVWKYLVVKINYKSTDDWFLNRAIEKGEAGERLRFI